VIRPIDEQKLRSHAAAVTLEWVERRSPPFTGEHKGDFVEVIEAAHIVADESRLVLQRWVDAGRRAGMSWGEVGDALGITKQAAQQRFRSDPVADAIRAPDLIEVRLGAHAFNEVGILRREGLDGHELVGTSALALVFRRSDHPWEYQRLIAVSAAFVMGKMSRAGWTHVSSWFPFHYFKRPIARVEDAPGGLRSDSRGQTSVHRSPPDKGN
jgi:hypothetical protein